MLKSAVKYFFDVKDFVAAERILRLLIEKAPEYSGAYHRLGIALARQEKMEEALSTFEQALVHEPNDRQILERIINASKILKRHDKTERYVRLILSLRRKIQPRMRHLLMYWSAWAETTRQSPMPSALRNSILPVSNIASWFRKSVRRLAIDPMIPASAGRPRIPVRS